jgi:predicted ABC-type ATPase
VLAGHNGSGKSTMWNKRLSDRLKIPLINADRLTLSILPDRSPIPTWAQSFRDNDERW